MTLQRYLEISWIRPHQTSPEEIRDLLAIADRDIGQSQIPGLGPEWRFGIAYNAALQLATAALAATGYQADRQNKHQRTIECLAWTVGLPLGEVALLDLCRRKRHTNVYEQIGAISDQEAAEMIGVAQRLQKQVIAWLRRQHPSLMLSRK